VIETAIGEAGRVSLFGVVRGLTSEVPPLLQALDAHLPASVGLSLAPQELTGITEYFVGAHSEPLVPLGDSEVAEAVGLAHFGEVRVPHPAFRAALEWGSARSVPVTGIDPGDDEYAGLFAQHIGYLDLVRRTVSERRLVRTPPPAATAEQFAIAWNEGLARGKGSLQLALARDERAAEAVRALRAAHGSVAVVVDRERFEGMRAAISATL
jgi:hypothetical protein